MNKKVIIGVVVILVIVAVAFLLRSYNLTDLSGRVQIEQSTTEKTPGGDKF
ncbi:MAG: hypothetical protein UT36_C0009G0040 [Candidatus Peregrinibacteria bacterium GW2011_GWF2_39_17]|nr:MAG: hypothetical protein UT36_C0009G0040 [Candidatus Peregrinibacteria bacterium GW2011_GWF2_39_17]